MPVMNGCDPRNVSRITSITQFMVTVSLISLRWVRVK